MPQRKVSSTSVIWARSSWVRFTILASTSTVVMVFFRCHCQSPQSSSVPPSASSTRARPAAYASPILSPHGMCSRASR